MTLRVFFLWNENPARLQVTARRGLTRFVGRHRELEQLQRALEQAKAGHGQIVGVMGEPGLGKSRLFYELVGAYNHTPLQIHGCLVLEAYSASHGKASPYLPVIELLKGYFDIQAGDEERKRREKLTGRVLTLDRSLEDILPYLFFLLRLTEPTSPLQQMDSLSMKNPAPAPRGLFYSWIRGTLLAMFQFGSLPHSLAMKSIELFGKEVLPAIREV